MFDDSVASEQITDYLRSLIKENTGLLKELEETPNPPNLSVLLDDDLNNEIIRKYKLELLVEFGELANETRCFKFWSKRQKGDKEKVLEEYIDCLFMILYFCNINDVSLNEKFELPEKTDLIDAFLKLYEYGLCMNKHMDKDIVKKHIKTLLIRNIFIHLCSVVVIAVIC